MTRTARQPHDWLTLGVGVTASLTWASLALRAIMMDGDPSIKALFVCAAVVIVGFALGAVIWILAAPKRAKRPTSEATALREAPFVMLGIAFVGAGASPILDTSTEAWGWTTIICGSLVGGLNLGLVFMRSADEADPSDVLRPATAPQSDG